MAITSTFGFGMPACFASRVPTRPVADSTALRVSLRTRFYSRTGRDIHACGAFECASGVAQRSTSDRPPRRSLEELNSFVHS